VNGDRLLREIEKRLAHLPGGERGEVLAAVREEMARDRRWQRVPEGSVEVERARRMDAEALRDVLEAVNRPSRLAEILDEVLRQLSRIVVMDSTSIALLDEDGRFRIIAGRGFPEPDRVLGTSYTGPLTDLLRQQRWPLTIDDVSQDERFTVIAGSGQIRSWAGLPLLVEGEVIGLLCMDRREVDAFDEDDLHRAKAVAFSAGAAIRKARLLDQVQRYARLMERVVQVDEAVLAGRTRDDVAQLIVDGALRIDGRPGGLLALAEDGPVVLAASGTLRDARGRAAPAELTTAVATRMAPAQAAEIGAALGVSPPARGLYLLPLCDGPAHLATLALLDPDGPAPDDRLLDAYALRAASAWRHTLRA
jgi:GAF domain-containing protein